MTQITVNRGAPLWDAVELLFGAEAAEAVAKTATALLSAKNLGHQEGFELGMKHIESAYDHGYEVGHQEGFREGYDMARDVLTADEQPDVILLPPPAPITKEDLQFATDEMPEFPTA